MLEHRLRFGLIFKPVDMLKSLANPVIVNGQHVGAAELKHQEHVHRPFADTPHLRQAFQNFVLAHSPNPGQRRHCPVDGFFGEIPDRGDFLP